MMYKIKKYIINGFEIVEITQALSIRRMEMGHLDIIVFHGFMGSWNEWNDVLELFDEADRSYRFYFFHLPGHGNSSLKKGLNELFIDLRRTLESLKVKNFCLVGYSMGGRVALGLTHMLKGQVKGLFLESTHFGLENEDERKKRLKWDYELFEVVIKEKDLNKRKIAFGKFLKEWYQQKIFIGLNEVSGYQKMLQHRMQNDPILLNRGLQLLSPAQFPSYWDHFKKDFTKLYYICGERDLKYYQLSQKIKYELSSCQTQVIRNCSHNIHVQNPKEYHYHLQKFLCQIQ